MLAAPGVRCGEHLVAGEQRLGPLVPSGREDSRTVLPSSLSSHSISSSSAIRFHTLNASRIGSTPVFSRRPDGTAPTSPALARHMTDGSCVLAESGTGVKHNKLARQRRYVGNCSLRCRNLGAPIGSAETADVRGANSW